MPTTVKLYLSSTATTTLTPGFAAWTRTSEADRLMMATYKDGSAMTSKTCWANANAAANDTCLNRQYISAGMAAGFSFATTDKFGDCEVRCSESAANDNIDRVAVCLKVYDSTGTTLQATLLPLGTYNTANEWATDAVGLTARSGTGGTNVSLATNYTTVAGDVLVFEIGGKISAAAGGTSVTGTQSFGSDNATDIAGSDETDTVAHNPWFSIIFGPGGVSIPFIYNTSSSSNAGFNTPTKDRLASANRVFADNAGISGNILRTRLNNAINVSDNAGLNTNLAGRLASAFRVFGDNVGLSDTATQPTTTTPIVYVTAAQNTGAISVSGTVVVTITINANEAVVVVVGTNSLGTGASAVNDSAGNVYTNRISQSNTALNVEIWTTTNAKAATSVTVSFVGTFNADVGVATYRGVKKFGRTASSSGTSSTGSINLTTQFSNNWMAAGIVESSALTPTANTGNLRQALAGTPVGAQMDNTSATPASVTCSDNIGASVNWAAVIVEMSFYAPVISDMFGFAQALAVLFSRTWTTSASDSLALTDAFARLANASRVMTDNLALTDAFARLANTNRVTAENFGVNDTTSRLASAFRMFADNLALTDSTSRVASAFRVVADSLALTDAFSRLANANRVTTDNLALTDSTSRHADAYRMTADNLGLADAFSRRADAYRIISDGLAVNSAVLRQSSVFRVFVELLGWYTDSLAGPESPHELNCPTRARRLDIVADAFALRDEISNAALLRSDETDSQVIRPDGTADAVAARNDSADVQRDRPDATADTAESRPDESDIDHGRPEPTADAQLAEPDESSGQRPRDETADTRLEETTGTDTQADRPDGCR